MSADDQEAREFAQAFQKFLGWIARESEDPGTGQEVVRLVRGHLAAAGLDESVVTRDLPPFEHVNLQVALDAWMEVAGRSVAVHGLALPPHFGEVSLQQLVHGDALPPLRLSAPDLVDLPSGPGRTRACLRRALLLVEDARGRYAVFVRSPEPRYDQTLGLEVAGLATAAAQEVLGEIADLRSALNVYRGQVLELAHARDGGIRIVFPVLPRTTRSDVVLPEEVLRRIERHTVDVAGHRDALLAAGQHLKRGLLLFGPPGTGKTHTMRYVVQRLAGCTVLLLSGESLALVGMITQLARELAPAVLVLEDVDLVAEDRGFGMGASPVLFSLLDAMDGAAADADLLFLLTTNRADLLEPALAARPGRVDVAVEIGRPDPAARRRLFELYGAAVPLELTAAEVDEVVERTAGVTASFIKELLRRAVLESLAGDGDGNDPAAPGGGTVRPVTGAHVSRALDDLLDSAQSVTRALLGSADEGSPPPQGRAAGGHGGTGWMPHPGAQGFARPGLAYRSDVYVDLDDSTER